MTKDYLSSLKRAALVALSKAGQKPLKGVLVRLMAPWRSCPVNQQTSCVLFVGRRWQTLKSLCLLFSLLFLSHVSSWGRFLLLCSSVPRQQPPFIYIWVCILTKIAFKLSFRMTCFKLAQHVVLNGKPTMRAYCVEEFLYHGTFYLSHLLYSFSSIRP